MSAKKTLQNVIDSNGSVIIYFNNLSGRAKQTLLFCLRQKKPCLLIYATGLSPERIHKAVAGNQLSP